jgi:hypothetical protein
MRSMADESCGWGAQPDRPLMRSRGGGRKIAAVLAGACAAGLGARAEFDSERHLIYSLGQLTLRPQLEIDQTYDSNVTYAEEDEVDDLVTAIRPGLRAVYGRLDENFFSLTYTLDASWYVERDDLNNVGHLVTHQSRFRWRDVQLHRQADRPDCAV